MVGTGLFVLAGIFIYLSLSAPKVYVGGDTLASSLSQTEPLSAHISSAAEKSEENSSAAPSASSRANEETASEKEVEPIFPLDINTATLQELMAIEGLGETKASAIIEYREHIGRYTDVSQIMEIKGFGEATYEMIEPYLTVK